MAGAYVAQTDPSADRLFVTKIPQQATREDVAAHFSRFGLTTDVYLPAIPGVPGHKGIAFVSYSDPAALQLAITNGPHEIAGHEVVVDVAAPRGTQPHGQAAQAAATVTAAAPEPLPVQMPEQASADRLFVTKVPPVLQREHLREHFSQFGGLTDVYMPSVPGGGGHKGICFVSFSDPSSLQLALQHAPHEIHGHPVVVDVAAPRGAPGAPRPHGGGQALGFPVAAAPQVMPVAQAPAGWPGTMVAAGALGGLGGFAATAGYAPPAAAPPAGPANGTPVPGRLFVTRVTPDMTKVDLQLYFQQFGQLEDVYIPTGGKGIAFVSFKDSVVSQRVLQAQQHFVKPGKAVVVDQAMDRPPLGGRGGGGLAAGGLGGAPAFGAAAQPARYAPY